MRVSIVMLGIVLLGLSSAGAQAAEDRLPIFVDSENVKDDVGQLVALRIKEGFGKSRLYTLGTAEQSLFKVSLSSKEALVGGSSTLAIVLSAKDLRTDLYIYLDTSMGHVGHATVSSSATDIVGYLDELIRHAAPNLRVVARKKCDQMPN
jgi:hypothetical protein